MSVTFSKFAMVSSHTVCGTLCESAVSGSTDHGKAMLANTNRFILMGLALLKDSGTTSSWLRSFQNNWIDVLKFGFHVFTLQ